MRDSSSLESNNMSVYDEEIDLRPYIQAIFRRWWLIGVLVVLFAVVSAGFSIRTPMVYEATASILLTRSQPRLELAEQFPTITELPDTRSRMDALISLAKSDSVALKSYDMLSNNLSLSNSTVSDLKLQVNVKNTGDLIMVTARDTNPIHAAEIANTWAEQLVEVINQAYSGEQPLAVIQTQRETARLEYETAQLELETFIQNNQMHELNAKISESKQLLESLRDDRSQEISYYSDRILELDDLLIRSETLKSQLQAGNHSTAGDYGDALAVLLARASNLGVGKNYTLDFQVDAIGTLRDDTINYVSDLDALTELLQDEKERSSKTLETLVQEIYTNDSDSMIELISSQLREFETRLEREEAQQKELTSQRNLSWETYQVLVQKETEIKNSAQATTSVSLASQAILPDKPMPKSTARNGLIGGVLGLAVGIVGVMAIEWWQPRRKSTSGEPVSLHEKEKGKSLV